MSNQNVNNCVVQIEKMLKNYKIFLEKLQDFENEGNIDEVTRKNLYEELKDNVISIFDQEVRKYNHQLPNEILTSKLKQFKFQDRQIQILKKTLQNTLGTHVVNDLNQRIAKRTLNEVSINKMLVDELSNLNIGKNELETIFSQVTVEKKMEIFSYLKAYIKSGDYEVDRPKNIQEIFEKINNRTLNNPQPFTFNKNGEINYSIAPGNSIDVPYISTKREFIAIDTTYATQVGIENDSFIRHIKDVYFINKRLQDASKVGNIPFDTLIKTLKEEYNTKQYPDNLTQEFNNLSKDEQINLLNQVTNYEVIHNTNSKQENEIMQRAYPVEIYTKQKETNYSLQQIKSFVKSLNIYTVNQKFNVNINENLTTQQLQQSLNYIRKNNLIKQNIFNILYYFQNYTGTNKNDKMKDIIKSNLDILAKGKLYTNTGDSSQILNTSLNKIKEEYNLIEDFDIVYENEKSKMKKPTNTSKNKLF